MALVLAGAVAAFAVLIGQAFADLRTGGAARAALAQYGTTLRIDSQNDFDYVDPALSFFGHSWQLHHATCLRLVAYPDASPPLGSTLIPDAAVSLPTISPNGRKYTFRIRDGLHFSPPSNELVSAQNFKWTIERDLHPGMQSPAVAYYEDIVGAGQYMAGRASEITGIVASGKTLSITLERRKGDFLARLALPFACAVPRDAPITPEGSMLPSAGPYYLVQWDRGHGALAVRNPNYRGRRASTFDRIVWTMGISGFDQVRRVEAGQSDHALNVPASERQRLREKYGPGSPRQSYFVEPQILLWYLALNTERFAFANKTLRRAVAFALSRIDLTALHGFDGGVPTDQILPPGIPGFRDHDVFPLAGDLEKAKALAAEVGVSPENPIDVVMYSFDTSFGPPVAQYVKDRLAPVGINVEIRLFDRFSQSERMRTRGEPFDIGLDGWGADYLDPYNVLDVLLNGERIKPRGNSNISYFDNPVINGRLDAASRLNDPSRYKTYGGLDRDLSAAAPIVPYVNSNRILFFSERIGCHAFTPLTSTALNALCLRP